MRIDTDVNFKYESNIFTNALKYYGTRIITLFFLSIGVIAFILFSFYYTFDLFYIHGISMQPTLNSDWAAFDDETRDLAIIKTNTKVERGDIVVTRLIDGGNTLVIKRLIAIGGDAVYIQKNTETGHADFFVNGEMIDQSYVVYDRTYEDTLIKFNNLDCVQDNIMIVPYNKMFYLGDNRTSSVDSLTRGCDNSSLIYGKLVSSVPHYETFIDYILNGLKKSLTPSNLRTVFRINF